MFSEAFRLVGHGASDQNEQVGFGERAEFENLRARDERAVDAEEGILRGRADEPHDAILDLGEEHILLGLVEAVDFVDEENRAESVRAALGGLRNDAAYVRHIALHPAQALEA